MDWDVLCFSGRTLCIWGGLLSWCVSPGGWGMCVLARSHRGGRVTRTIRNEPETRRGACPVGKTSERASLEAGVGVGTSSSITTSV